MHSELLKLLTENETVLNDILGQEITKKELKSSIIAKRHVIVSGPPGIGKTTLAKSLAKSLPKITVNDCGFKCSPQEPSCPICKNNDAPKGVDIEGQTRFVRIQGSPDLTVEDIFGDIDPIKALEFGPSSIKAFTPGKIFKANNCILFFDEINRCPEKLQNALLQVLEEGYVTIGSYDIDIPTNFVLIATMNPKDINTERLSDVLLDRFDIIEMGYPEDANIELEIIEKKGEKLGVKFPDTLTSFLVDFVRHLRYNDNLEIVPSVRASLGLYARAQANAILEGKDTVTHKNITDSFKSVLSHRIKLKPSSKYLIKPSKFLEKELDSFADNNPKYKKNNMENISESEAEEDP